MTLIPEPHQVRTLRTRFDTRTLLERDIAEQAERRFQDVDPIRRLDVDTRASSNIASATAVVLAALAAALELHLASPRTRRLRKEARLVAHYQSKLDRIPPWKLDTHPTPTIERHNS